MLGTTGGGGFRKYCAAVTKGGGVVQENAAMDHYKYGLKSLSEGEGGLVVVTL